MTLPRESVEEEPVSQTVSNMLPSWLASLVVHLALVLLLAVFTVVGEAGWQAHTVELDFESLGVESPEDDAMMAAAIEIPSELDQDDALEELTPEPLDPVEPLDVFSKIELVETGGTTSTAEVIGEAISPSGVNPIKTSVFGQVGEGSEFVYVFDRSDSMNSTFSFTSEGETVFSVTPLAASKAELMRSLKDLSDNHLFHILFYNHEVWKFDAPGLRDDRLVLATSRNKRRASKFVASVYGTGRTKHIPPLEAALRMHPDVIFLLTDGEEKDDPTESELRRLRKLNDGRTKINVIQFCYKPRTNGTLVKLAEETGGQHTFMDMARLGAELAEKQLGPRGMPPKDDMPADDQTVAGDPPAVGP
ncbi:MAG: hypothetical protein DWQ37_13000 [Planctomycetota bacterium]|nr:MAG: hypothetical protein DWQ37_13000 [Planctomycetota bacterium]